MQRHRVAVSIGDQVYLQEAGEEVGSVRNVDADRLIIYIENATDFVVPAAHIAAVHAGKVILDASKIEPALRHAIAHAHDREEAG
jgi:hypothetical protein